MKLFISDIVEAIRLYKCVGSLWQYKDQIPHEVKRYIIYKHEKTMEEFDEWARAYVDLPALEFRDKLNAIR